MSDDPTASQAPPASFRTHSSQPAASRQIRLAPRLSAQTGPVADGEILGLRYLRQLDRTPRISREDEMLLALRIEHGDPDALLQLVAAHGWLVSHFARRYQGMGLELYDLVQEGYIGLMRAARGFDRRRGYRFATYAAWWVRQSMGRAVTNQGHTVRIPIHLRHAQRRLSRARHDFAQLHGREPLPEELATDASVTVEVLEALQETLRFPVSLETPLRAEEGNSLEDRLADEQALDPEEEAVREDLREEVRRALGALTEREQQVLRLRFGVGRRSAQSLQQVGNLFHLTRERIRQIERRALGKLRRGAHGRRLQTLTGPGHDRAAKDG
jgi:RNA polymerase primary sigma factor